MTDKPENPYAFPNESGWDERKGMTLRDYFAAAALTGAIACFGSTCESACEFAEAAYKYADAMLAVRVAKKGGQK